MTRGYTLVEFVVTLAIIGIVTAVTVPRWSGVLDRIAVERAATELTTALAVARNAAVLRATRTRLVVASDSLRVDELGDGGWIAVWRWPGPEWHAVSLVVSNPTVMFGPTGIGFGASNTTVELQRGTKTSKVTTSRIGRVKRW